MPDPAIDNQPDVSASSPSVQDPSVPINGELQPPAQDSQPTARVASPIMGSVINKDVTQPGNNGTPTAATPPHVSKLAQFGHMAASLLGANPNEKPGSVFRHLVAGAILGGIAGAGAKNFGQGVTMGGGAVLQRQDMQNAIARKQKQQEFENQQKMRSEDREDQLAQATIAHMHVQDLHADSQMDLMQQEHIDKLNQYNNSVLDTIKEKGSPSRILVNGQDINAMTGNGKQFAEAYSKNPRAFDAPDGYYRIHTQTVDNSGLKYSIEKGWTDEEGKPVNMADRTTHHFYDIPKSVMSEHIVKTGKELNAIAGYKAFSDDDQPHSATLGDLLSLKTIGTKNTMEQADIDLKREKLKLEAAQVRLDAAKLHSEVEKGNRQDMLAAYETTRMRVQAALGALKDADTNFSAEDRKKAKQELDEATSTLKDIQEKLFPATKLPGGPTPTGTQLKSIESVQKQILDVPTGKGEPNWRDMINTGFKVVMNPVTGTWKAMSPSEAAAAISRGGVEVPPPDRLKPQALPPQQAPQIGDFVR